MKNKVVPTIKQLLSVAVITSTIFFFSCETTDVYVVKTRQQHQVIVTPPVLKVKPEVVLIPESDVYVCVEYFDGIDVFFVDGVWWCYYNGVWWKTAAIGTPWVVVETAVVPKVLLSLPPGWRNKVLPPSAVTKPKVQKEIKTFPQGQKKKKK